MFIDFLYSDDCTFDDKYSPFLYIYEIGIFSIVMTQFPVIASLSETEIIDFIKRESLLTLKIPDDVIRPDDAWISNYLLIQSGAIKSEAERLHGQAITGCPQTVRSINADLLIKKMRESSSFEAFLDAYLASLDKAR